MKLIVQLNNSSWANMANLAERYTAQLNMTETTAEFDGLDNYDELINSLTQENPLAQYQTV